MFRHSLLNYTDLAVFETAHGRFYESPIGRVPSVTTVLNGWGDKSGLLEWRERVGKEQAAQILEQARHRGNDVHRLLEQYLLNNEINPKIQMPINYEAFINIKPILDKNVQWIYGVELPLWSNILQSAGRTDALVDWNSHNAILDFKTSLKPVKPDSEKVNKWFLQTTAYAMMAEERYAGFDCDTCIIIVVVNNEDPQLFIINNILHRDQVLDIFINREK